MARRRRTELQAALGDAVEQGQQLAAQIEAERADEAGRLSAAAARATLPLIAIRDRFGGDGRPVSLRHVRTCAESICVVGLLAPLVVDREDRLLCGGHRRAAIALIGLAAGRFDRAWLIEHAPAAKPAEIDALAGDLRQIAGEARLRASWDALHRAVPVRRIDIDAAKDRELALAIETIENTQRKQLATGEIRAMAQRFVDAGYVDRDGRPKAGEKALVPSLAAVFGASTSTIRRYLGRKDQDEKRKPGHVARFQLADLLAWVDRCGEAEALDTLIAAATRRRERLVQPVRTRR